LIAADRRGAAFGQFDIFFGAAWLAESITLGLLYGRSLGSLVITLVIGQLLSIPLFLAARSAVSSDGKRSRF
jgi:hypothetical protein